MDEISVLIAEDEQNLARTLSMALLRAPRGDYQVALCSTAAEALGLLESQAFALVVTDLLLPSGSGLELLRQVQMSAPQTRTLLITAYGTHQQRAQAEELADAVLVKPFDIPEFIQTVEEVLGRGD